jgi:poly [ADP-ribose] polymerase 6/8
VNDSWISQLVDMGFSVEMAKNACKVSSTLEEATNILLTNPDSIKKLEETPASSGKTEVGRVDDIFQNPNKALTSEKKPGVVDTKYGFLAMLTNYIRLRLSTLNNYCIICDNPHVFATGNMLKPAVCSRELCVFSFQQLGVAGDAADEIATAAEVVDLLVCFATVAAKSPRNTLILDPYPNIVDPVNPKRHLFTPNNKELDKVVSVLSKFPSVEQMCQAKDFSDMKKTMDKASEYAFPLLQWIISSNRSYLVKLNSDKQIKSMETSHQYLLLSAPPEKEAKFRTLKGQHGSTFAFHGSSIENWHSILRQGLRNASGTKLQMNGAAYGAGIYLSPHAATSFGYCRMYGQQAPKVGKWRLKNVN